jgi:hypothetical protein
MKILGLTITTLMILLAPPLSDGIDEEPHSLARRVPKFELDNHGLAEALMKLTKTSGVIIGFEAAPGEEERISLSRENATVTELMDEIVRRAALYKWEERDGIIHVFSKDGPSDLLSARIRRLKLHETNTYDLVQATLGLPEVESVLRRYNLQPASYGSLPNGRPYGSLPRFSVDFSDTRLLEVLDTAARASHSRMWIVRRTGIDYRSISISFR